MAHEASLPEQQERGTIATCSITWSSSEVGLSVRGCLRGASEAWLASGVAAALAGLLAVGIALLTVSFQSIRAALMNPVKSLRTE